MPWKTWDTILCADSVETCPAAPNVIAIGTYQVLPPKETATDQPTTEDNNIVESDHSDDHTTNQTQQQTSQTRRTGSITLLYATNQTLIPIATRTFDAVLDMRWRPNATTITNSMLAVCGARGTTALYSPTLQNSQTITGLEPISTLAHHADTDVILQLAIDWTNDQIAVSDSSGCAKLFTIGSPETQPIARWKAHDLEAWSIAACPSNPTNIATGGDDCRLRLWDSRMLSCADEDAQEITVLQPVIAAPRSSHDAGVCTVAYHPTVPNVLFSGSYDDNLRVWDTRNMKISINTIPLEGGVWRIRIDAKCPSRLVTPCMYRGVAVLDFDDITFSTQPNVSWYEHHTSIAYGCAFLGDGVFGATETVSESTDQIRSIATCSFYDHQLHLWGYNPVTRTIIDDPPTP